MKKLSLFFVFMGAAVAQQTNVVDTLYYPGPAMPPAKFNGSIDISWITFTACDGSVIPTGHIPVSIKNGALNVWLQKYVASSCGVIYTVRYALTNGLQQTESWNVPASTPTNLAGVRVPPQPPPPIPYIQSINSMSPSGFFINAGANITVTPSGGNTLTIAATGAGCSGTDGSVVFIAGGVCSQDNTHFFYDGTNHFLGVGPGTASSPSRALDVVANTTANTANQVRCRGYQCAFEVLNQAATQNFYFGVNDADSNTLQIGAGRSAGQGLAPILTGIASSNVVFIGQSLTGWGGDYAQLNINSSNSDQAIWARRTSSTEMDFFFDHYNNGGATPQPIIALRGFRGSIGAVTSLLSGDYLGIVDGRGAETSSVISDTAAQMAFVAAQNWSSGQHGSSLFFKTTPLNTTTALEVARFDSHGRFGLGLNNPAFHLDTLGATPTESATHIFFTGQGGLLMGFNGNDIQGRTSGDANGNLELEPYAGYVEISQTTGAVATVAPQAGTLLHLANANGTPTRIFMDGFGAAGAGAPTLSFRNAAGTIGTPTAVQSGDPLGTVVGLGYGATGYASSGRVRYQFQASQNWTDAAQGTKIILATTPNGSTTIGTAFTVDQDGTVQPAGGYRSTDGSAGVTGATCTAWKNGLCTSL